MLCLGWSTGVVVSDLSCKVAKTVCRENINIDKTSRRQKISKRHNSLLYKDIMGSSLSSKPKSKMDNNDDEYYDRVVCNVEEINDGQFKEIKLDDDGKVSKNVPKEAAEQVYKLIQKDWIPYLQGSFSTAAPDSKKIEKNNNKLREIIERDDPKHKPVDHIDGMKFEAYAKEFIEKYKACETALKGPPNQKE